MLKMGLMFKRKQILVAAAVISVLIGCVYFFTGIPNKKEKSYNPMRAVEVQSFINEELARSAREMPNAFDLYIVRRAGTDWEGNPFSYKAALVRKTNIPSDGEADSQKPPLFLYTGYIETENRKVAVIDNTECLAGDPLNREGFFVKKISPDRVIVEDRKEKKDYEIPLYE